MSTYQSLIILIVNLPPKINDNNFTKVTLVSTGYARDILLLFSKDKTDRSDL